MAATPRRLTITAALGSQNVAVIIWLYCCENGIVQRGMVAVVEWRQELANDVRGSLSIRSQARRGGRKTYCGGWRGYGEAHTIIVTGHVQKRCYHRRHSVGEPAAPVFVSAMVAARHVTRVYGARLVLRYVMRVNGRMSVTVPGVVTQRHAKMSALDKIIV